MLFAFNISFCSVGSQSLSHSRRYKFLYALDSKLCFMLMINLPSGIHLVLTVPDSNTRHSVLSRNKYILLCEKTLILTNKQNLTGQYRWRRRHQILPLKTYLKQAPEMIRHEILPFRRPPQRSSVMGTQPLGLQRALLAGAASGFASWCF